MGTRKCRSRHWNLILGILSLLLMVAVVALAQEQPPPNQAVPGARGMGPEAGGPMRKGMPGPGMMGSMGQGMMAGRRDMGQMGPVADLMRPDIQKELGITAEQRQKLEDIRFNSEKESIQHDSALRIQRLELSRLTDAENPDRAAIDKKIQEIAREEASLLRSSIYARLDARAILTTEQRAKLEQLEQNRPMGQRMPGERGIPPGQPGPRPGKAKEGTVSPAVPARPPME